jgi:hypothetical protein
MQCRHDGNRRGWRSEAAKPPRDQTTGEGIRNQRTAAGAKTAYRINHTLDYAPFAIVPDGLFYSDRRWMNVFAGNATFTAPTFDCVDPRTGFFTVAYSTSPGNGGQHGRCRRKISGDLR